MPNLVNQTYFSLRLKDGHLKNFSKPCVMGIINLSSNSFFNPMKNNDEALKAAEKMMDAGASILDIGAQATNPSVNLQKESLTPQQEIDQLLPFLTRLKKNREILISVDTYQPEVMRECVRHGADMINDQRALQIDNAMQVAKELNVPVCLMHSFNFERTPGACDKQTLLSLIKEDLKKLAQTCKENQIDPHRIILDPGFGGGNYGKNTEENFYLLAHLQSFTELGYPLLVGWSRKSMVGEALNNVSVDQRLYGSLASATLAAFLGASIIRVHDVPETMDVIKIINRVHQSILS